MRDRFTEEEWINLKQLPIYTYVFIAGADGCCDARETKAFRDALRNTDMYREPLQRVIFSEISQNNEIERLWLEGMKQPHMKTYMEQIQAILNAKLSDYERRCFRASIALFGLSIARASKRSFGFFGIGRVSRPENLALDALSAYICPVYPFELKEETLEPADVLLDFSYQH